jgi:hypothetical protein
MKSLFEQMGGTYRQEGDYLIPNLLPPKGSDISLGKYGRLRRTFLKEHHNGIYTAMLMDGSLWDHLHEIDQSCKERLDRIVTQMAEQENVTETLKAADQMEWVRRMNNIHNGAEEIVLHELVYDV